MHEWILLRFDEFPVTEVLVLTLAVAVVPRTVAVVSTHFHAWNREHDSQITNLYYAVDSSLSHALAECMLIN